MKRHHYVVGAITLGALLLMPLGCAKQTVRPNGVTGRSPNTKYEVPPPPNGNVNTPAPGQNTLPPAGK